MNKISVESVSQLNKILSYLSENEREKIPENVWKIINNKTDKNIDTKINEVSDINEKNILPETRKYLSFIFLKYLATEEEKVEYNTILKSNEEQYQIFLNQKYSIDNIFDKRENLANVKHENIEEKSNLPVIQKQKFWKIIFNKIKRLFK